MSSPETKELVNHPSHYTQGIEPIEIIESYNLNFCIGNAIKYILRAPFKGTPELDIDKAIWYLNRYKSKLKPDEKV